MTNSKPEIGPSLRLRVFAGPNGSGKTTIINAVRNYQVNGRNIDFGHYINADDIAKQLRDHSYAFDHFQIPFSESSFLQFAATSGLIHEQFSLSQLKKIILIGDKHIQCQDLVYVEQLAQLIARYLREQLLIHKKRFSFETVFSHPSNIDIMKKASEMGYKVYLYFVSTESAEINKFRVKLQSKKEGMMYRKIK